MISIEELKRAAKLKGLSLGNAEKDYLLDLVLLSISKNTKDELVFKGGTCLYKFYKVDRFSEDADFTAAKKIDVGNLVKDIVSDLGAFGIRCRLHKKKEPFNSVLLTLRCEGPLFRGTPLTFSGVRVDINLKSSIDKEPINRTYSSFYSDVPSFSLLIMDEEEILAEKVRAILSRNKARDIYDLWFLLGSGVKAEEGLITKKFDYYKTEWSIKEFSKAVENSRDKWVMELKPLVKLLPDFGGVKKLILQEAKKWRF